MGKPARAASFVGRARELDALATLVGTSRLVTICGMGGVGKTTIAAELSDRLDLALRWVDLAGVRDRRGVEAALHVALDVPVDQARPVLLVVDNCEHVRDGVAMALEEVAGADGPARVIATSRVPLRIAGESVFQLEPLAEVDARALFLERSRARNAASHIAVDDETVTQICRRLDGLPLAIELAAARSAHLGVNDVLAMLDDRFTLLTAGATTAPDRHQTLDASIRWGYDLLSSDEQILLSRLGVFDGFGFGVVDAAMGAPLDQASAIDLLGALVDNSFVAADGSSGRVRYRLLESIRAFALERLEERGEVDEMRTRKLEAFERIAHAASADLGAGAYDAVFDSLAADIVNVRSAMDWAIESLQADRALLMAAAAAPFWAFHGQFREMGERLRGALASTDGTSSAVSTAGGMLSAGFTTLLHGDLPTAEQLLHDGARVADAAGLDMVRDWCRALRWLVCTWMGDHPTDDPAAVDDAIALARSSDNDFFLGSMLHVRGTALSLVAGPAAGRASFDEAIAIGVEYEFDAVQSWAAGFQAMFEALPSGDLGRARSLIADARIHAARLGFDAGDAAVLGVRTLVEAHAGNITAARAELLAEVEQRAHVLGVTQFGCFLLGIATWAHHAIGDDDIAANAVRRQIAVHEGGRVHWLLTRMHEVDGLLAFGDGRLDDATRALEVSRAIASGSHMVAEEARALIGLGRVSLARGEPSSAATLGRSALELVGTHGLGLIRPDAIDLLAACAVESGGLERAARLLGAADRLRLDMGTVPLAHSNRRQTVAAAAAGADFDRARGEGGAADPDEMLEFALRGSGANRRAIVGWDSLTGTERQVVEHVVAGLTNRAIADRMFVSPNTVKTHLSSVYRKLDLSNRAGLAALVSARGT